MKINYPQRAEGRVWVDQFNKNLQSWLASELSDVVALEKSIDALRNLLEREPYCAGFVANLLSTLARQHADHLLPVELEHIAFRGLEAVRLVTEESESRTLTQCNLLNYLALAYINRGRYGTALDRVTEAAEALAAGQPFSSDVAALIQMHNRLLSGTSREALLDYATALQDFTMAEESAGLLVNDVKRMGDALIAQVSFEYQNPEKLPENFIQPQLQLLWRQLSDLRIKAAAGAGRCAIWTDPESLDRRLTLLADISEINGIGDQSVVELSPLVSLASPAVAKDAVERILQSATKLDLDVDGFTAVLYAALSANMTDPQEIEDYQEMARAPVKNIEDPLILAATYGLLLLSTDDRPAWDETFNEFLDSLYYLSQSRDQRLAIPSYRMVFDEPVLTALLAFCEGGNGLLPWEPENRIQIAELIDYDFSGLTPIDDWLEAEPQGATLDIALSLARDRLARAHCALRNWPEALVLIVRSVNNRTLFIALTDKEAPIAWIAEQEFAEYARALADYLDEEISILELTGAPGDLETFRELSGKLYQALPKPIRSLIVSCRQLLVCPDNRTDSGSAPFELFHDGNDWLGVSKTISRFPNLRALVRCLEGTARRDEHRRNLSIAIPDAEGFANKLEFAESEVEDTRARLESWGWDAPKITPERVSEPYLLERLPYVTHLHIASHGAATGQQEYLVFQNNKRLSSADLLGNFIPLMPTAFINACELGKSRWVGSGRAQSIPYAFAEAGSRAVIANLLPVEDKITADLAGKFYQSAQKHNFGDSLREARRQLAADGVNPLFWGSTVLIGDPSVSLVENAPTRNVSEAYLDAMVIDTTPEEDRKAALDAAQVAYMSDIEDTRLTACVGLLNALNDMSIDSTDLGKLAEMARIAYEIDHLPLLGLLVFTAKNAIDSLESKEERNLYYDHAINLLESLEGYGDVWKRMLDALLVGWLKLQRGERMTHLETHGPQADDDILQAVTAMMDIQLAMEARTLRSGKGPTGSQDESTVENILRNAVIASREYQLEDMLELYDFAELLVEKLKNKKAISGQALDEAAIAFAGLLHWLWSVQNLAFLAEEMIQGQTGVLQELLHSLRKPWKDKPWFERLRRFEQEMQKELDSLEGLPYDDKLYPRIDEVMAGIQKLGTATLEEARQHSPDAFCQTTVWLLGCLIKHNTYSFVDGSVPEDLNEKLKKVLYHFEGEAEGNLYPWLDRGFKSVREAEIDELQRWKYGFAKS